MTLSDSWDTPPSNPNNRRSSVYRSEKVTDVRTEWNEGREIESIFANCKRCQIKQTKKTSNKRNYAATALVIWNTIFVLETVVISALARSRVDRSPVERPSFFMHATNSVNLIPNWFVKKVFFSLFRPRFRLLKS